MNAQRVARLQVVHDDLAVQLHPCVALPGQPLHAKSRAAEDARTQSLLKADRELDPDVGAHEAVPVNEVAVAGRDVQGDDLPRQLGGESEEPRPTDRGVFGHEQGAAGERAADRTDEPTLLPAHRRARLHLNRHRHPRQLAGLREHLVVGLHAELEHRHHGADDLGFHGPLLSVGGEDRSRGGAPDVALGCASNRRRPRPPTPRCAGA